MFIQARETIGHFRFNMVKKKQFEGSVRVQTIFYYEIYVDEYLHRLYKTQYLGMRRLLFSIIFFVCGKIIVVHCKTFPPKWLFCLVRGGWYDPPPLCLRIKSSKIIQMGKKFLGGLQRCNTAKIIFCMIAHIRHKISKFQKKVYQFSRKYPIFSNICYFQRYTRRARRVCARPIFSKIIYMMSNHTNKKYRICTQRAHDF